VCHGKSFVAQQIICVAIFSAEFLDREDDLFVQRRVPHYDELHERVKYGTVITQFMIIHSVVLMNDFFPMLQEII